MGANYREACRTRAQAESGAEPGDCRRGLEEPIHSLELLVDRNCVAANKLSALIQEADEPTASFTSFMKRSKLPVS